LRIIDQIIHLFFIKAQRQEIFKVILVLIWGKEMKKLFMVLSILLTLAFIFSGCSGSTSTTTSSTTVKSTVQSSTPPSTTQSVQASAKPTVVPSVTPQSGGTLAISVVDVTSLGYPPEMTGSTDGPYSSVCLETLFRFDQKLNLVPLLATDWKADANNKTITLTLRQGVKFHDGTVFDAAACKWNMDQFKAAGKVELQQVTSIDVMDDHTIRITMTNFDNTILTNLAGNAGRMISPTAFQAHNKDWAMKNPVGTGPWQFVSWQKDIAINWKRFDGYWDGKPYIDEIIMRRYADATSTLLDFKAGNLSIYNADVKDAADLKATGKYNMVMPAMAQIPQLAGYATDPASPFANLKVRQALSYAIDNTNLANSIGLGSWKPQNQWTLPGSWAYNPNVVGYPYNPKKAKDLLTEAGYPGGLKTTLSFFNVGNAVDEMTIIQNLLKESGFDCTLNPLQRPAFNDIAAVGKGWSGIIRLQMVSTPDPLSQYNLIVAGGQYRGIYLADEFVKTYAEALKAPDADTKQKLVWQLTQMATDKYCMVTYLYQQLAPTFKVKELHDDQYNEIPNGWISPKAWMSK
jgi:peptide/nickel transport system substrate-binding protein